MCAVVCVRSCVCVCGRVCAAVCVVRRRGRCVLLFVLGDGGVDLLLLAGADDRRLRTPPGAGPGLEGRHATLPLLHHHINPETRLHTHPQIPLALPVCAHGVSVCVCVSCACRACDGVRAYTRRARRGRWDSRGNRPPRRTRRRTAARFCPEPRACTVPSTTHMHTHTRVSCVRLANLLLWTIGSGDFCSVNEDGMGD